LSKSLKATVSGRPKAELRLSYMLAIKRPFAPSGNLNPMSPTDAREPYPRSLWYLAHVLALMPIAALGCLIYVLVVHSVTSNIPPIDSAFTDLTKIAAPGTLIFWLWMLQDHFRQCEAPHSRVWSVALILGSWGTAFVYFFLIWRPRHVYSGRAQHPRSRGPARKTD
jgi:hypothetical protein